MELLLIYYKNNGRVSTAPIELRNIQTNEIYFTRKIFTPLQVSPNRKA
jgi:hypothetical protein